MKQPIIAALTISALLFSSCKTQQAAQTVAEDKAVASVVKEKNEGVEWMAAGREYRYIHHQMFKVAMDRLQNAQEQDLKGKAVFMDVPFLMYDQTGTYRFFSEYQNASEPFKMNDLRGFCRNQYNPDALAFLRACQEFGIEVVLMAPEMELDATIADLQRQGLNAFGSTMEEFPHYGKTSSNMTLMEYKSGNRVVMVLSTSLGEASSMTGVKYATGNTVDDLFEAFGDKLILFPNPASN